MATDLINTLVGQSSLYWQNYKNASEGSPGYFLLTIHPLVYVGAALLYLALCFWLSSWLKHPLNIMLAAALTAGHTWGSSTWFIRWMYLAGFESTRPLILLQWSIMIVYFVLIGICAGAALTQYMRVYQNKVAVQSGSGQPQLLHSGINDQLGNRQG